MTLTWLYFQVPIDPDDPEGEEKRKEAQQLIDEAEPLTEEEIEEKEQLLTEVISLRMKYQYCS